MHLVNPLDLLPTEWQLLQDLATHTAPFRLNDVFLLHNREGLTRLNFYEHFFWLQVNGFVKVLKLGAETRNATPDITYQVTAYGRSILEKCRLQKEEAGNLHETKMAS